MMRQRLMILFLAYASLSLPPDLDPGWEPFADLLDPEG